MTASIFDLESLQFLLAHNPCFVKIANDRSLDWLIGEVPRKVRVIRSVSTDDDYDEDIPGIEALWCCSKYPALASDYPPYPVHISDHTIGLDLWYRNKPSVWEKHLKLTDSTGLDAGEFAITPEELKEIL